MGGGGGVVEGGVRWCWVNFQCRGILLIWMIVGQGPAALEVGAGGGCLDIFSLFNHFLSSFSLSQGDGPISTEILSQRAVKPKTTSQLECVISTIAQPSSKSRIINNKAKHLRFY